MPAAEAAHDPYAETQLAALRTEIAELKVAIASAKDERLRRVGVESSTAVLQARCAALGMTIIDLRAALAAAGIDADEIG